MEINSIFNANWLVKLEDHHPYFSEIRLWRSLAYSKNYTVVVVDAEKFMACWQRHLSFLPPVDKWEKDKVDGIRSYLQSARPVMARPLIETRSENRMARLLTPDPEGVIQFANGRHRTRYIYDAGAKTFPVEVLVSQVELFRHYCVNVI
jgi:hypothetical protein